ncbi:hypothetical protein [Microbacterium sp. T32]|uniref:hypothetical protein n=1 Tax=Microbacterium sp. T32 TaxID=1776083 RepID=UPI0007AC1D5C|nr:hypothetical protein [Microbacterium sp. T32]KZE40442.1 ATP/GTP-binding protein [Microbacterium sp. T32]
MANDRALEQHIAMFGESGSGKTVLLSSFYGAAQESSNKKRSGFRVLAEDPGQGTRLRKSYLGMKNSGSLPAANHFRSTAYSFLAQPIADARAKPAKSSSAEQLRLVWHDYPGEWLEQDVSGPAEAKRKVETFRSLLSSDVALLLVDAQRLLENSGEEERYLKSLLTSFTNGLLLITDDILDDGVPLTRFPRIWTLALSKSDLVPDMDVSEFADLLIEKVGDEINELRDVLGGIVAERDALSVGEDFVLLSSARFTPGEIHVHERVGVDLLLPIAAVLPLERKLKWAERLNNRGKVASELLGGVGVLAKALGGVGALGALIGAKGKGKLAGALLLGLGLFGSKLEEAAKAGGERLKAAHADAVAKRDRIRAILTAFAIELEDAESDGILLRSPR